jgi:hypothetical protein
MGGALMKGRWVVVVVGVEEKEEVGIVVMVVVSQEDMKVATKENGRQIWDETPDIHLTTRPYHIYRRTPLPTISLARNRPSTLHSPSQPSTSTHLHLTTSIHSNTRPLSHHISNIPTPTHPHRVPPRTSPPQTTALSPGCHHTAHPIPRRRHTHHRTPTNPPAPDLPPTHPAPHVHARIAH